jgi:hypothetical protein
LHLQRYILFYIILLLLPGQWLRAQTTPCDLTYKDGKGINKTRLIGLHEDLLLVSDTGKFKIINIEKIARIRFDKGTYMLTGAVVGAVVGFIAGLVYYDAFGASRKWLLIKDPTLGVSLFLTIPCAVLGSIIGLAFRNVDEYDLSKMHSIVKAKEIKFIMKDHPYFQ